MGIKKRTEIFIETERLIILPAQPAILQNWCVPCNLQVEWLTPELAAQMINVAPRLIYRWVEAGQLHYHENAEGALLICRNSLFGDMPRTAAPT